MERYYGDSILITGGGSGIGLACARLLAAHGYEVFAASRRPAEAEEAFEGGGRILPVEMDVRNEDDVREVVEDVCARAKGLGIVLHCAGYSLMGAIDGMDDAELRHELETNFFGVVRVNRYVLPHLRRRGRGLCLVISSVAGLFAVPFQTFYSVSKFALEAYTAALRNEMAPFGMRAALVEPGPTKTHFTESRRVSLPKDSPYRDACLASVAKMERSEARGKAPETVARVVLRLVSRKKPPVRTAVCLAPRGQKLLHRLLPSRTVQWLLGLLYARRRLRT